MDYLEYYGFHQEPFSNAPVSRFFYDSAQHSEALVRLTYALDKMKGLAVLVGDIGAGKTTLARRLLDELDESVFEAALLVIIHRDITTDWLLRRLAIQLGVECPSEEKLSLLGQLYERLVQIHESGKKAVVLIDEAQMLESRELMEEFRGLLNLEVPDRKLLSFVFFGLPSIEDNLKKDPPLEQRVALKVRLDPFDRQSTDAYIRHRVRTAGGDPGLFAAEAVSAIHGASGGSPRLINTVCDNLLLEGALSRRDVIGPDLVRRVAHNLGLPAEGADRENGSLPAQGEDEPLWRGTPESAASDTTTAAALEEIDRVLASLGKL
ncbi:MAG TPA: AAA family ATPase [Myxococcales bacterium LLY-WYZ-16_1]|nr:AAA family ATPase [Myxococcales bacterium LLY-WYZ-16_1]